MADAGAPATNPHTYGLHLAEGPRRLFAKLTVHGITVSDSGLAWTTGNATRDAPFADIASVHLGAGLIANSTLDTCRIEFADGDGLVTANWGANGLPDEKQLAIYREFVRDLHARLAARRNGTIRFTAGFPQWRYNVLCGAAACLGLLWIAALVIVLVLAPGLQGVGTVIAGAFLLLPIVKLIGSTRPRAYKPDDLPAGLLS
jgi:hypothetical protein